MGSSKNSQFLWIIWSSLISPWRARNSGRWVAGYTAGPTCFQYVNKPNENDTMNGHLSGRYIINIIPGVLLCNSSWYNLNTRSGSSSAGWHYQPTALDLYSLNSGRIYL